MSDVRPIGPSELVSPFCGLEGNGRRAGGGESRSALAAVPFMDERLLGGRRLEHRGTRSGGRSRHTQPKDWLCAPPLA